MGIKGDHLSRMIATAPKVQQAMKVYGWALKTAKDLGEPGKRKALARLAA